MTQASPQPVSNREHFGHANPAAPAAVTRPAVCRPGTLDAAQFEIAELIRENAWQAVVDRFHPFSEKAADLAANGRSHMLRSRVAFALGQLGRFDDAMAELKICLEQFPGNFLYNSSMAYTAYNSLWAAKNREYFLKGQARRARIEVAHVHFRRAQELRPDGVTNYYREGMLFYRLEDQPGRAFPLFRMAIANWEGLSPPEQAERHQERKNYVKSLYQAASSALKLDKAPMALSLIEKCLAEDEASGYMDRVFKFFALGKVRHHLRHFEPARDALKFALQAKGKDRHADFVCELLARTYLALGDFRRAESALGDVPEHRRRPYIRWTEADVLLAQGRGEEARKVLLACAEKDRQSRHKALIRLARIEHEAGRFEHAAQCAAVAGRFFQEKWGNPYLEALYWQALAALGLGDVDKARCFAGELETHFPESYRLRQLREQLP